MVAQLHNYKYAQRGFTTVPIPMPITISVPISVLIFCYRMGGSNLLWCVVTVREREKKRIKLLRPYRADLGLLGPSNLSLGYTQLQSAARSSGKETKINYYFRYSRPGPGIPGIAEFRPCKLTGSALRLYDLNVVSQHPVKANPKGLSVDLPEHRDAGGCIPVAEGEKGLYVLMRSVSEAT